MNQEIQDYNNALLGDFKLISDQLSTLIENNLPLSVNKIWHSHPVWFIDGNPIVGYDKLKNGLRLLFWSGASFEEKQLKTGSGKFKDASKTYITIEDVNEEDIKRWLHKSIEIQWDYKNLIKRKGVLIRLK